MTRIPAESLGSEALANLGIKLGPPLEQASKRHLALANVLKAIQGLEEEDVLWVLHEAKLAHKHQGEPVQEISGNGYVAPISWTIEVVANTFGVKLSEIMGRQRTPSIVLPRQVAMFILWSSQAYTLQQIGDALGGRTPATVSHGFSTIVEALQHDKALNRRMEEIREILK